MKASLHFAVGLYLFAAAGWALSGKALQYPAFGVSLLELALTAWMFPVARFQPRTLLSPKNWALFLFHIHILVAPLLGIVVGFEPGTLPRLPPVHFINVAMLLSALSHLCFALGVQLTLTEPAPAKPAPRFSPGFDVGLAGAYVLLGAAGLWLTFGGLSGYLQYVTVPETHFVMAEASTSLEEAVGTFLRPFLPFGLMLWWSTGISPRTYHRKHVFSTLLLLVALIPATASYNRASMVGPTLTVLATYSLTVRRLSVRTVALVGLGLLLAGVAFGAYRHANMAGPSTSVHAPTSRFQEVNEFLQVYGEGPQFLGFLLERTQTEPLHLGRTLVGSLLYPVPILGKDFRESSGVHFYNRLIYGRRGVVDQIIPASGELLLNFHLAAVCVFFTLLGFLVRRMDARFQRARTAFSAAASFYLGMWLSFPIAGSLAVLSQMLIYAFWPIYGYFGLRAVLGVCLVHAGLGPRTAEEGGLGFRTRAETSFGSPG